MVTEDRRTYGFVGVQSIRDNIKLPNSDIFAKWGFWKNRMTSERVKQICSQISVKAPDISTPVENLSGGNQQKAIVGREIELQSDLMIFVQPTRGLDIGAIENIHKQIIAERDKGKAILLISLELDEIMNCADTIGVIYNGAIEKIAPADTLTTNQVGEFMMGVKQK